MILNAQDMMVATSSELLMRTLCFICDGEEMERPSGPVQKEARDRAKGGLTCHPTWRDLTPSCENWSNLLVKA